MHVVVEVVVETPERPRVGAPILVEARDTTLQDVAAVTLGAAVGTVQGELGTWLDTVELAFDRRGQETTVWVHVDVDGDGRVSPGDYITMSSYAIPPDDDARITVTVRRV